MTWRVGRASRRKRWQLKFARTCRGLTLCRDGQQTKGQLPLHRYLVLMMNNPAEAMGEGRRGVKVCLVGCDRPGGRGRAGAGVLPLLIPTLFPSEPAGNGDAAPAPQLSSILAGAGGGLGAV